VSDMTKTPLLWDRRPDETDKSWAAFQLYRDLPVYGEGENKRTLANVASKLGYSTPDYVERWSAKYNWVERASAFDTALGASAMELRLADIEVYQDVVRQSTMQQLVVLNAILEKKLADMNSKLDSNEPVDTMEINRLAKAMEVKDNLARRIAHMPTTYTSEKSKEELDEDTVFVIGVDKS